MTGEEKQAHADEAEKAWDEPMVQAVLTEFAWNNKLMREGFTEYGLAKIVSVVAQIARAHALGIKADDLRGTPEEYGRHVIRMVDTWGKAKGRE